MQKEKGAWAQNEVYEVPGFEYLGFLLHLIGS